MSEPNAFDVYATLDAVAALVGVSENRISLWVRRGRLGCASALVGGPKPRHKVLYCLGDVQELVNEEARRQYKRVETGARREGA